MATPTSQVSQRESSKQSQCDILEIDLERVKSEPIDVECESDSNNKDGESPIASIQDAMSDHVIQRFNRSRYFRRNYSSPESSVCEVCQAEFAGPDVLRLHKIAHFNTATVCYVCDTMFTDSNGCANGSKLTLHMASHHKTICTPTGNYKPEAERSFVCPLCLQRFSSNKILSLHTSKQHNNKELKSITCKICSVDFIGSQALEAHLMSRRHKEMKVKVQSLFMCVDCRSIFPARDSYAMHMMMRAQSESCSPLEDSSSDTGRVGQSPPPSTPVSSKSVHTYSNGEVTKSIDTSAVENTNGSTVYQFSKNSQSSKEQRKYSNGDYICTLCDLRFYHPETLNIHMRMTHQNLQDLNILTRWARQHLNANRISPPFLGSINFGGSSISWTCVACGQDFYSCDSLAMHVMEKHSGSVVPTSAVSALDPSTILNATAVLHNDNQLLRMSALNGAMIKQPPFHKTHNGLMNNHHSDTPGISQTHRTNEQTSNKEIDGPHEKRRRLSTESSSSTLAKFHIDPSEIFSKCSFCHEPFTDKEQLLRHLKYCSPEDEQEAVIKCNGCTKQFRSVSSYSHHCCPVSDAQPKYTAKCLVCGEYLEPKDTVSHFDDKNKCKKKLNSDTNDHRPMGTSTAKENGDMKTKEQGENNSNAKYDSRKENSTSNEVDKPSDGDRDKETENDSSQKDEIIKSLVQDAIDMKRNRRKNRAVTRLLASDDDPAEENGRRSESPTEDSDLDLTDAPGLIAIPVSPASSPSLKEAIPVLNTATSDSHSSQVDATGHENLQGQALFNFVMTNSQHLIMCKYCEIIYTNRTMYYLHMGLHNLNNPWQCNLCGKVCSNVHEFSSHVIHYR